MSANEKELVIFNTKEAVQWVRRWAPENGLEIVKSQPDKFRDNWLVVTLRKIDPCFLGRGVGTVNCD